MCNNILLYIPKYCYLNSISDIIEVNIRVLSSKNHFLGEVMEKRVLFLAICASFCTSVLYGQVTTVDEVLGQYRKQFGTETFEAINEVEAIQKRLNKTLTDKELIPLQNGLTSYARPRSTGLVPKGQMGTLTRAVFDAVKDTYRKIMQTRASSNAEIAGRQAYADEFFGRIAFVLQHPRKN